MISTRFLLLIVVCGLAGPAAAYTKQQCINMGYTQAGTATYSSSCPCGSLYFTIAASGPSCISRNSNGCVVFDGNCAYASCSAGSHPNCQYSYSAWTCSTSCGTGTLRRTKSCPGASCETGTTTESGGSCTAGAAAAWATWSQWSTCGVCGGTSTRSRSCNTNCYGSCSGGSGSESRSCSQTGANRQWSTWSLSQSCNAPLCGSGVAIYTRSCNGECGSCGSGATSRQDSCSGGGSSRQWSTWSLFQSCNAALCGSGVTTYSRSCNGDCGSCGIGTTTRQDVCSGGGSSRQWTAWSLTQSCNAPLCGTGVTSYSRSCNGDCGSCGTGAATRQDPCSGAGSTKVWSSWSLIQACNATLCGSGSVVRARTCNGDCGTCEGPVLNATECSGQGTNKTWSPWVLAQPCNAPLCGNGTTEYIRTCNGDCGACNGSPNRSDQCVGQGTTKTWSPWALMEACTALQCGNGTVTFSRACIGDCGACDGASLNQSACDNEGTPSSWTVWTAWSACNGNCGPGLRNRTRTCVSGTCSRPCPGTPIEFINCTEGVFRAWSAWADSSCSASCGPGTNNRTRTCVGYCGAACSGETKSTGTCFVGNPYNWSAWSPWGACNATCGPGTAVRTRECRGDCGATCVGAAMEAMPCLVAVPRHWTSWMPGTCGAACGLQGQRPRTRICNGTCGADCQGPTTLSDPCQETPYAWSMWSSWSSCNSTCGGVANRSRTCQGECGPLCSGSNNETSPCGIGAEGAWGEWEAGACNSTCRGWTIATRMCIRQNITLLNETRPEQCRLDCASESSSAASSGLPIAAFAGAGVGLLAVIVLAVVLWRRRARKHFKTAPAGPSIFEVHNPTFVDPSRADFRFPNPHYQGGDTSHYLTAGHYETLNQPDSFGNYFSNQLYMDQSGLSPDHPHYHAGPAPDVSAYFSVPLAGNASSDKASGYMEVMHSSTSDQLGGSSTDENGYVQIAARTPSGAYGYASDTDGGYFPVGPQSTAAYSVVASFGDYSKFSGANAGYAQPNQFAHGYYASGPASAHTVEYSVPFVDGGVEGAYAVVNSNGYSAPRDAQGWSEETYTVAAQDGPSAPRDAQGWSEETYSIAASSGVQLSRGRLDTSTET